MVTAPHNDELFDENCQAEADVMPPLTNEQEKREFALKAAILYGDHPLFKDYNKEGDDIKWTSLGILLMEKAMEKNANQKESYTNDGKKVTPQILYNDWAQTNAEMLCNTQDPTVKDKYSSASRTVSQKLLTLIICD